MTLLNVSPWALHQNLLDQLAHEAGQRGASNDESSGATADWTPPVDIEEYSDRFVLHADIPGVDPESVDLTLENGTLTVSGQREQYVSSDEVQRRRSERIAGHFHRRFSLPDTADADGVSASSRHGVLEVSIPKRQTSQARKIAVQS